MQRFSIKWRGQTSLKCVSMRCDRKQFSLFILSIFYRNILTSWNFTAFTYYLFGKFILLEWNIADNNNEMAELFEELFCFSKSPLLDYIFVGLSIFREMEEAAAESGSLWLVAALSASMFVGSYAAGYLPLFFTMSEVSHIFFIFFNNQ